jgi:hypothetical protein
MSRNESNPRAVIGASLRYKIDPRDVPASKVARRLGLTLVEFDRVKDDLFARNFPRPDPTTGNYDLVAVDAWQDARSGSAAPLTDEPKARDARAAGMIAERARRLNGL